MQNTMQYGLLNGGQRRRYRPLPRRSSDCSYTLLMSELSAQRGGKLQHCQPAFGRERRLREECKPFLQTTSCSDAGRPLLQKRTNSRLPVCCKAHVAPPRRKEYGRSTCGFKRRRPKARFHQRRKPVTPVPTTVSPGALSKAATLRRCAVMAHSKSTTSCWPLRAPIFVSGKATTLSPVMEMWLNHQFSKSPVRKKPLNASITPAAN